MGINEEMLKGAKRFLVSEDINATCTDYQEDGEKFSTDNLYDAIASVNKMVHRALLEGKTDVQSDIRLYDKQQKEHLIKKVVVENFEQPPGESVEPRSVEPQSEESLFNSLVNNMGNLIFLIREDITKERELSVRFGGNEWSTRAFSDLELESIIFDVINLTHRFFGAHTFSIQIWRENIIGKMSEVKFIDKDEGVTGR